MSVIALAFGKERRAGKMAAKRARKAGDPPRQASEEPKPAQV
ncbi:hypothetical protein ABZ446_12830 [Streptomyces sp. NPDC005813]